MFSIVLIARAWMWDVSFDSSGVERFQGWIKFGFGTEMVKKVWMESLHSEATRFLDADWWYGFSVYYHSCIFVVGYKL